MEEEAKKYELGTVCAAFGLGKLQRYESLGGTRNQNWRCETDRGPFVIRRRYAGYCDPAWLAFDEAACTHLSQSGAPIALPITTPDGHHWHIDRSGVYQATAFVDGREFQEGREADIRALAKSLAQFHRAGQTFSAHYDKLGPRGETGPKVLRNQAKQIVAESPDAAGVVEGYLKWITNAEYVTLEDWRALPHTLTHGDIQPANIIIDRDDIAIFVDLDWCAWLPRIYDLAWALLLCCTHHETPICGDDIWSLTQEPIANPALAKLFLETYERSTYPLTTFERQTLPAQTILSWCSCRLSGALKVAPSERATFLDRPPINIVELSNVLLE